MKKFGLIAGVVMMAMLLMASESNAQRVPFYGGLDSEGFTTTNHQRLVSPVRTIRHAARDHFSPHPIYAYSGAGVRAGLTHQCHQEQAQSQPWHTGYGYWRWDQPTALVVPANSTYQMTHAWGVGNNRSLPIHHQFGRAGAGIAGGGGGFSRTPLYPSHSYQTGVYPVRAPW